MKCQCGFENDYNNKGKMVGIVMEESGFLCVKTYSGKLLWVCRKCFKTIQQKAKEIYKVLGDEHIYFPDLIKNVDKYYKDENIKSNI